MDQSSRTTNAAPSGGNSNLQPVIRSSGHIGLSTIELTETRDFGWTAMRDNALYVSKAYREVDTADSLLLFESDPVHQLPKRVIVAHIRKRRIHG